MSDLSPIANALKLVAPVPQAQSPASEQLKPVPTAEIDHAVPPVPVKGGEPGLGEHLDLYDTEASQNPPTARDDADTSGQGQASVEAPKGEATAPAQAAKTPIRMELLGDKPNPPPPKPETPLLDLPFLTPLGGKGLGRSIDARI